MADALEIARASGLIGVDRPVLVMLSGGADSVCLLDVCLRLGAHVSALHVNYALRGEAHADERHCRELCDRLGVELVVEHVSLQGSANLQAAARELRYAHAERHAEGDYAAAHTASDQAETVLYRLATSPGRRALIGMQPRRGRLVRPLLGATAEQTRAWCRNQGLTWREDESNTDPRFARTRVRHEVLAVLKDLNPAAERTITETSRLLADEAELVEAAVDEAIARLGDRAVELSKLREEPPGLARCVLRRLADTARRDFGATDSGDEPAPALSRGDVDAILRLGTSRGGTATLDLGDGLRAVAEYGVLRFTYTREPAPPAAVTLTVPGSVRFGEWEVQARLDSEGDALVAADELSEVLTVRPWASGDRMQPVGLGGTKSLQDLFADRKIPRSLRHRLPVVESAGRIVWVAGVMVDKRFDARSLGTEGYRNVALSARRLNR